MDSSDIYYSDNSQLIDENNTEWIENTVLIENQDVTWQEDGPEITVDYSEPAADLNKTFTENDGYLTADNEDDTTTETSQYFSILDSNCDDADNEYSNSNDNPNCILNVSVDQEEVIVPDITKTEIEDDYEEPSINIGIGNSDNEVILYRMEGSDDLFAVQLADDGNGNFQKYKYRVRQNEDGQFEAIPGTIEIQRADQNDTLDPQNDPELDIEESEPRDQKPNAETLALINQQISENAAAAADAAAAAAPGTSEIDNNFYMNSFENINPEDYLLQNSYDQDTEEEYQTVEGVHVTGDSESNSQPENIEETEFVSTNSVLPEESSESECESHYEIEELDEDFQDEGVNDAGEDELNQENPLILQHKSNIGNMIVNSPESEKEFKQHLSDNRNVTIYKDDKNLSYFVVKTKEKENVSLIRPVTNFNSSNLRSILKNNHSTNKINSSTPKPVEKHTPTIPAIISSSKPAKEPLPLPPVSNILLKSARQPRKQKIKPIERAGSEIIVQPLVYSLAGDNSTGFLVSTPGKRKRVVEEILQVSDESDPEFTLKPKRKKVKKIKHNKRGRPKNAEITIIDSDEELEEEEDDDNEKSEGSVIEVLTDQESSDFEGENNNKQTNDKSEENQQNEEVKKDTGENAVEINSNKNNESTEKTRILEKKLDEKPVRKSIGNKQNKCPYCPKTFPRLITLKKHMNIHSTRRSLRSRTNTESENKTAPEETSENRKLGNADNAQVSESVRKTRFFNCFKCKLKFLTESQYIRHQTIHLSKTNKKPMSPLKKTDKQILISQAHLRSQKKSQAENMLKTRGLSQRKSVVNDIKTKESFKCEYCGQVFSSRTILGVHRNSHKTFPCPNCKTTFTAKLLLDDHLRKNCVKISPKKTRPKNPVKKFSPSKRINSKCEICQQIFPTPRSLLIHKNVSHKPVRLITKPVTEETKKLPLVKKKGAHGGVPMSLKMQQAFRKLKVKS